MIILLLAVFGLIFGSFVNAWVWRLHEQEAVREQLDKLAKRSVVKRKQLQSRLRDLSIAKGRSMCPHCGHELASKDLIPLFSWLWLHGHCRYCNRSVSWQYPLVEVATAIIFVGSYLYWPTTLNGIEVFHFIVWLAFVVVFMALVVYDLRWFILPDKLTLPMISVAVVITIILAIGNHTLGQIWEPAVGALLIGGLFYGLFGISGGAWIGGGDVKLGFTLGILVATPLQAVLVIFFASCIGTLVSIPTLLKRKHGLSAHIPFGPYLIGATIIVMLFGTAITNWYTTLFLPT